jgi:hypothetical protein
MGRINPPVGTVLPAGPVKADGTQAVNVVSPGGFLQYRTDIELVPRFRRSERKRLTGSYRADGRVFGDESGAPLPDPGDVYPVRQRASGGAE